MSKTESTISERDKQTFQKNVVSYCNQVRKLLYNSEGSAKRIAEAIKGDEFFSFFVDYDTRQKILIMLADVSSLPKGKREETKVLLRDILKTLDSLNR